MIEYRGYRIAVRKISDLHANIWPPGNGLALGEIPEATREEGEAVLIERAKAVIDADIERVRAGLAVKVAKA